MVCGQISIPMCFVDSVSYTKTARVITHLGGYVTARGFEAAEISVKAVLNKGICDVYGFNISDIYTMFSNIKTDRVSPAGCFYLGGNVLYPALEFTLTNINKTEVNDETGVFVSSEYDMTFSGVKATKNVNRDKLLEFEPVAQMPVITLVVDGKELIIQDSLSISHCVTTSDSIDLTLNVGSDMDLVYRDGYCEKLLNGGYILINTPQSEIKYYVIQADLVDELLSLTGSIFPSKANQIIKKTFQDTTLKHVLSELAVYAGIDIDCRVDGSIEYYIAFGTPIGCIKDIQASAGFIMSYRDGVITCVNVPESLDSDNYIDYISMQNDSNYERLSGVYWFDGINKAEYGTIDNKSAKIYSCFRSKDDYSGRVYKYLSYIQNMISITIDIDDRIDNHSVVSIRSNDSIIPCMCEFIENDWINNTMKLELHYI